MRNLDKFNKTTSENQEQKTDSDGDVILDVRSGISMADPFDVDHTENMTEDVKASMESMYSSNTLSNDMAMKNIFLFIGNNHIVWSENWCRMESLACDYFENQASYVFGIIFCLLIGFAVVTYNTFVIGDWFDANVISASCGMLFFFVVFIRLLLVSTRFSSLEKKHIALLQIQHSLIINQYLYADQDGIQSEKIRNRIYLLRESLSDMIKHIKFVSLSPKIAGVSLNAALVRLFVSAIIGGMTSAAAVYWRSR